MIIYVDIDDTICHYPDLAKATARVAIGKDYSLAEPLLERIERINQLFDQGNTIIYWTARGTQSGINWFQITLEQLNRWGCRFHELRMNKPVYDLFIDDKNINSDSYFQADK